MSGPPTISIAHSAAELSERYVLAAMAKIWDRSGYRVVVGPSYAQDAEVCILHHDRTRLDASSLPAAPSGRRLVNGEILDISKRRFSALILSRGDDWPGSVIVKTNLNHFGLPDQIQRKRNLVEKLRKRLRNISWRHAHMLPERTYPILNSVRAVPDWVWNDPDLIVEKFMPEHEGDLYCLRGWMFFGDKSYGYRLYATHPLVKTGTMVRHEYLEEVPGELVSWRNKMGFDFGKFDYVVHDGKAILLDANKTPMYTGSSDSPRLNLLATGIEAFRR